MTPSNSSTDSQRKWPPSEYYHVRRAMEEWVPPLEILEQMKRDEPHRFVDSSGTHEQTCLLLYGQGKSREDVFAEISSCMSIAETRALEEEEQNITNKIASRLGLFPSLANREVSPKKSAGGFKRLEGTSQGCRFDVPPTKWIEEELIAVGARRPHGTTHIPDLEGKINLALRQERWPGMPQNRFNALRQSLLFASNLLMLSAAALVVFVPDALAHPERNASDTLVIAGPLDDDEVFTHETYQPLAAADRYFRSLAPTITWVESDEIMPQNSWWGINGSGMTSPEERDEDWDWDAARERDEEAGYQTRQITIAIASEFVDALLTSKPDSEQHLFATFYAGITIAHELAHFWANHRYSTVSNPAYGEPFFGEHLEMELGDAYIAWLFGGFVPHPIGDGSEKGSEYFRKGMQWERAHEVGMTDSGYDIRYSISISHIERMLSQEEWMMHIRLNNPAASRRALLHPDVPFRINETARTVKWRKYRLWESPMQFDVRGLSRKGDEGFVDYSLCPLGFCDMDWDDVPRFASTESAGLFPDASHPQSGSRKSATKALDQQKTNVEPSFCSTGEDVRTRSLTWACERNELNGINEHFQKTKRHEGRSPSRSSNECQIDNPAEDADSTSTDQPKTKLCPLPAAARIFFQHDTSMEQRQKLETKLRLYHHKKRFQSGDEDEYDSDDPLLAVEPNKDDPYDDLVA